MRVHYASYTMMPSWEKLLFNYTHGERAAAPELKIGAYVHMQSYGVVVDGTEVWNTAEADGVTVKENKAYLTLSETSATI